MGERTTTAGGAGAAAFAVAASVGIVHGMFSLYWALGGTWLLATVGGRMVEQFADARGALALVGIVKLVAAVAPLVLALRGWPVRRPARAVCWTGAAVLVVWGGAGAVTAQLVLAGAVAPDGGVDRVGMIGHAWIRDPMFVLWGVALAVGLTRTRRRRTTPGARR